IPRTPARVDRTAATVESSVTIAPFYPTSPSLTICSEPGDHVGCQKAEGFVGSAIMGEQHDLAESHVLQLMQACDDGGRCPAQAAFAQPERRNPEALLGELLPGRKRCVIGCQRHPRFNGHPDGGGV